ncbi:MAG: peptide chain release factor N(5)-glutamine methyltransferase [Bacteroidales bacterium]|nr:peptide chain release factor N(5)-glutamine methyltransferase [Bacteroidales bacterium]
MNIKIFKEYAAIRLKDQYEAPALQLFISSLLDGIASIPGYWYYTHEDYLLGPEELRPLMIAVDQAAAGRPLQYILGQVTFGGCQIQVDERVLIPRPETEQLWQMAVSFANGTVLDACTGSGCLAIALKNAVPHTSVFAFDNNYDVLEVAKKNALLNTTNVRFFQADLSDTEGMSTAANRMGLTGGVVNLLVSNPPYVTEKEKEHMKHHVLIFEPDEALFVPNEDPLVHYRHLADVGKHFLRPQGVLLVEINEAYGEELCRLFEQKGYTQIQLHKDFHGKDRFIRARREL